MRADRRLYLDVSMSRLVEECDAAFLLVAKGHEIPAADVKRLDLRVVDGRVVQHVPEPVSPAPLADVVLPVEVVEPKQARPLSHPMPSDTDGPLPKAPRKGKQK